MQKMEQGSTTLGSKRFFLALIAMCMMVILINCNHSSSHTDSNTSSKSNTDNTSTDSSDTNTDSNGSGTINTTPLSSAAKIIFLHHSTGGVIWDGGVSNLLAEYNTDSGKSYQISETAFPDGFSYEWNNYPYDYWNIWVNHAGSTPFSGQDTLEILTEKYDVIVFKHCFPVSNIAADTGNADIASEDKRIENYKLQYEALKAKMKEFPKVRFIVWTGAANVAGLTDAEEAARARAFFEWVKKTWDEKNDNIYVWDFFELETEGGNYLKPEYAADAGDSHPNSTFADTVAPYFVKRIVDVIEGRGDAGSLTGK